MERLIILDTETTGIKTTDDHRIIEVAALEMIDRQLTGKYFQEYFFPDREVDEGAVRVHGLTADFLKDKPKFAERVDDFLAFIQGSTLIIHNAAFDEPFLDHELNKLETKKYHPLRHYCPIRCTLEMARKIYPGGRNSLDALCQRFNVDNSGRELHGALIDCDLLAQVYINLTNGQKLLFQSGGSGSKQTNSAVLTIPDQLPLSVITEADQKAHDQYMGRIKNPVVPCWEVAGHSTD